MARASSGSRSSINSIEPLMSANSAVTVLRSPSTASAFGASSAIWRDHAVFISGAKSDAVHCPQNLKPGGFSKRHLGQINASGLVHCPQNFIPSGFSNPHFEQRISASLPLELYGPSDARSCSPRRKRSPGTAQSAPSAVGGSGLKAPVRQTHGLDGPPVWREDCSLGRRGRLGRRHSSQVFRFSMFFCH